MYLSSCSSGSLIGPHIREYMEAQAEARNQEADRDEIARRMFRGMFEENPELLLRLNPQLFMMGTGMDGDDALDTELNRLLQEAQAVCLEPYARGDGVRTLPCLHQFHQICIDQWLGSSSNCPVCKYDLNNCTSSRRTNC